MTTARRGAAAAGTLLAGVLGLLAASAAVVPGTAAAHGLVGKQDLPIPRWLFAWGAAVVLVASFVGLAVLWSRPRLQDVTERLVLRVPRALEVVAGALGVAAFVVVVYAGLAGTQSPAANIAPVAIFIVLWVGLPFLSLFFGDVFRAVNPWLAIGRAAGWVVRRAGAADGVEPLPYPERLGRWPAAVGILAFAWVELVYVDRDDPSQLAIMALAYAAVQLIGMSLYGADIWSRRADPLGVYFGLFARLAPLRWRDGALYRRPLLGGAPSMTPVVGTVALLCVMIGTTSFDGFSQGNAWQSLLPDIQQVFFDLGFNAENALMLTNTLGLIGMVCAIGLLYRLGVAGMHTVGRRRSTGELAGAFAHTLVPIALAYVIAHYFSALAYDGQRVAFLASDPLGDGSNIFGTASATVNYTWVSATGVWYVQVAALVVGHVAGLMLAHDRALALYAKARDATRSQYWMLAVMVAFTSLGLWLLSAAAQD